MARRLIECVANFAEGRRREVIAALAAEVRSSPAAHLLHQTSDRDHNRTVLTFAGAPDAVAEAAFRGVRLAVGQIDLTKQTGVHPRIGAADVIPFVPIEGASLKECAQLAVQFGERIWKELGVPAYLYEAAARRADRKNLENVRRGGFERLREEAHANPDRRPDIGGPALHPTAGATVVGARKILIAFNVLLDTADVEAARRIARKIRASSGGLPHVKALGVLLASRHLAQVTVNLTDYERTPLRQVFDSIAAEGAGIVSSEIIGLIPRQALEPGGPGYFRCENFSEDVILENRLATIE